MTTKLVQIHSLELMYVIKHIVSFTFELTKPPKKGPITTVTFIDLIH